VEPFTSRLVAFTESILTWRKRRKARRRLKQKQKNVILDWVEAFLQAALLVLLINQYLLQAYQIPSGSMIRTLLLGDRIFVNKVVYGPELLPGVAKLPGFARPHRREVIVFENPSYISRRTLFTILQRTLYMVTLSLVDIDRDENGLPRAQLLIKRAVGVGGDRFRIRDGDMLVRARGADRFIDESEFIEQTGGAYEVQRMLDRDAYETIRAGGVALARNELGLQLTDGEEEAIRTLRALGFGDPFALERVREGYRYAAHPYDERLRERVQFVRNGWYVPTGRIFPLGDNRDNSRDGRYFGPVHVDDVLGRAMIVYWPIGRIGAIR
jgi:signal peptidase I